MNQKVLLNHVPRAGGARAIRLEQVTIGYNLIEGVVAVGAGLVAGLVSLVGFGVDSGIEVMAAGLVLHRLVAESRGEEIDETRERRSLRLISLTFYALATYVVVDGWLGLIGEDLPDTSPAGVAITGASLIFMPWLARAKRRTGEAIHSRLLIADAAETRLCAWLSVSTFGGLAAYSVWGWSWLDPVAGFVIAGFALKEGRETWRGDLCCDH